MPAFCCNRAPPVERPAAHLLEAVAGAAAGWLADFAGDLAQARTLAAYHPWMRVDDPLGTAREPQRTVPPST